MAMIKNSEVRDGYLGDLPENIRINIMNIHKLITTTAQEVFKHKAYDPIRNSSWAKTMMDEFLVTPQDKKECGSVRVYKKGKRFSCMIQITGHVINNRNDIDHELFHDFVRHVHQNIRTQVRRKYDVTLTCESEHGELFEGFDIWTKPKVAKELWELFNDKATKKIKPIKESTDIDHSVLYMAEMNELPEGLQDFVLEAGMLLTEASHGKLKYDYRQVKDVNTGHRLLCIYSLKGAQITLPGHTWEGHIPDEKIERISKTDPQEADRLREIKARDNAEVQANIRKKGNTDHQSYGQKLLAIKDLETGEQWTAEKNNGKEFKVQGWFGSQSKDSNYSKTFTIKLGEVESEVNKTFKSSKNFTSIFNGEIEKYDMSKLSTHEFKHKFFRGVEKDNFIKLNAKKVSDKYGNEYTIGNNKLLEANIKHETAIIPEGVKEIGELVFAYNHHIKSIDIPKTVRKICKGAFVHCTFTSITLPEGLQEIEYGAFSKCTSLKSINIPKSVKKINNTAFAHCDSLPDSVKEQIRKITTDAIFESTNIDEEYDIFNESVEYLTEASHGKLKFDYRQVWDVKTGHRALLIYSLKGAKITYAGHAYPDNKDSNKEVQSNIRKKGNTDHQSYGQKLLAIKDLETGEQLQEIECRGIFSDDSQDRKTYKLKVGDIEKPGQKSFKSTKFINDLELMGRAEFIKDGRGTKLDNFNGVIIDGVAITNNPNKQQKQKIDKFKYRYIEMCMKKDDPDGIHAWNEGKPKYYNPDATKLATISKISKADVQKVVDDINGQEKGAFHHSTTNETSFLRQVFHKLHESTDIGYTEIIENTDGTYTGYVALCECIYDPAMNNIINEINQCDSTKQVVYDESSNTFLLEFTSEYANKLLSYLENVDSSESNECFTEASQSTTKPNADEKEAKRSLAAVASGMINGNKPITQYTADIIANIITKSLLPIWAGGLRKLSIVLDTKSKEPIFEFKIPTMTQDFVSRYVQGREPLEGFLRRNPDIKIRMTPAVFRSMTSADELFKFFKSAVKYYDSGVSKYAEKLMSNYIKLDHETKHLIANTKLSGLVTLPLQWLFQFDNVDMSKSDTFIIRSSDINQINSFVKNIYTKYAAPEKEKKQIIEDLNSTIQAMKEFTEIDDNFRSSVAFQEAVNSWYNGQFDQLLNKHNENWILEQVNTDWTYNPPSAEIKYLQEKFGVKKLKKIPADLVAYITIETEAIRDANDKMMIASYCISKLEIVEWYIELLEVGSNKYIVPHTKPYLESVRTQLLRCYANIMKVKITNPADRPIIDIKYPKGYEG